MADVIETYADGTIIERDFTEAELAQQKLDNQHRAKVQAEAEAKAQAKAELLERLGITADEAKLLLA